MIRTILHSVYYPPLYNGKIFFRERCMEKLWKMCDKRMILIRAGVGYGKTNLLALFYEQLEVEKIWLSIPQSSFTCVKFMTHLFYGVFEKLETPVKVKWESILHSVLISSLELDQLVMNLINLIEDLPGESLYIFLDDFQFLQFIEREKELGALQLIARFAPKKVHFVVASREEMPFPVNRLRLEGQLAEIGETELVFDCEELRKFLGENEVPANDEYVDWLVQKTEGWIAGICLIVSFHTLKKSAVSSLETIQPVQEYLTEILAEIPSRIRDFLQKTCIFETIPVDICNQYLDISDSQRILDELVEIRMLTQRYEESGSFYYRYHNLLKEFFLQQLDGETEKSYHYRLAGVYKANGSKEMQIGHLIAAGADQEAVQLIKEEAAVIVGTLDVNLLSEWLDYLSMKGNVDDPMLDMYRGWVFEMKGFLDEALEYYLYAEPGLRKLNDWTNWIRVRVQMAGIYWWNEDFAKSYTVSEETLEHVPEMEIGYRSSLYAAMGNSAVVLGERTKGIELLQKAEKLAREVNDQNELGWILNGLAFGKEMVYGDLLKAIQIYEEALECFKQTKNKRGLTLILTDLGYLYLAMNDLVQAEALLSEAEEICLDINNLLALRPIWGFQARLAFKQGNWLKAEEILAKFEVTVTPPLKVQNFQYAQFAFVSGLFYLFKGDYAKAEEWLLYTKKNLEQCGDASYFNLEYQLSWIMLALKTRRYQEAITLAERFQKEVRKAGFHFVEAETALLLAIARRNLDQTKGIELEQLCTKIEQGPYPFLLGKYADLLLEDLEEALTTEMSPCGEESGLDQPIRICFFGEFVVYNRGERITSRDWTNRKALDLLKYLLLHHDQWVRQEDLLDLFWPDSDVEKGKQSLYVALYNIRRKWEPDLQKGKDSQFIQGKRGMYRIQLPEPYWLDIEAFRDFLTEGVRMHYDRRFLKAEEFLKEAKRLYTGDFLQENLYDEWTRGERENLQQGYLKLLYTLAQIYGESNQHSLAVQLLRESLKKNPLQDQVHSLLMQYLQKSGQIKEAIQHYRQYSKMYWEDLGVEMPEEIRILYQKMVD